MSDHFNHLGSIWYHSEPHELTYTPNQFLAWDFFCRFLQQNGSSTATRQYLPIRRLSRLCLPINIFVMQKIERFREFSRELPLKSIFEKVELQEGEGSKKLLQQLLGRAKNHFRVILVVVATYYYYFMAIANQCNIDFTFL